MDLWLNRLGASGPHCKVARHDGDGIRAGVTKMRLARKAAVTTLDAANGTPDFHCPCAGNFGDNGQRGLPLPVSRSFELANQAIDRNQNPESDVHPQQRNQH